MSTTPAPSTSPRLALTRDRVHDVLAALCEEAGLGAKAADDAELIKFTNNAVYRLPGAGVVVRIAGSATVAERVPVVIQAARWLAEHDAPTVRLVEDIPQPVRIGGATATFWHLVPSTGPEPTGTDLGRILRCIHALPAPGFALPSWEPFARIRSRIADAKGWPRPTGSSSPSAPTTWRSWSRTWSSSSPPGCFTVTRSWATSSPARKVR
ncbi:hypothetical protein [Nocardiopsis sp. CNR-923]|uniref:hypothetical protein n=1 Tax=Nocardiopsis sp. CNR-923 TaxID=1904965 RepID=UPI0021CC6483|nr:hypothetical protein [Nocardiopsis sp. CNR-923]